MPIQPQADRVGRGPPSGVQHHVMREIFDQLPIRTVGAGSGHSLARAEHEVVPGGEDEHGNGSFCSRTAMEKAIDQGAVAFRFKSSRVPRHLFLRQIR